MRLEILIPRPRARALRSDLELLGRQLLLEGRVIAPLPFPNVMDLTLMAVTTNSVVAVLSPRISKRYTSISNPGNSSRSSSVELNSFAASSQNSLKSRVSFSSRESPWLSSTKPPLHADLRGGGLRKTSV